MTTEQLKARAAIAAARAYDAQPEKADAKTIAKRAPLAVIRARDVFKGSGIEPRRAAAIALAMEGGDEQAAIRRIGTLAFREGLEKINIRGKRYACIGGTAAVRR